MKTALDNHAAAFLNAVQGIPVHHVRAALNLQTPGFAWSTTSKGALAVYYTRAIEAPERAICARLRQVDLVLLALQARSRSQGYSGWHDSHLAAREESLIKKGLAAAQLAAAAPQLYDALQWALAQIEDDLDPDHQLALAAAHEALALATRAA